MASWWEELTKPRLQDKDYTPRPGSLGARTGEAVRALAPTPISEVPPRQTEPLIGGFRDRYAAYKAKRDEMQRNKIAAQSAAVRQAQLDMKKQTTITDNPDGTRNVKVQAKAPGGGKVTIESPEEVPQMQQASYGGAMPSTPLDRQRQLQQARQWQYENLLQTGVDQRGGVNLQPLAQLVDTWTGSQFARGFQDAEAREAQRLKNRVAYARELAGMGAGDEQAALEKELLRARIKKLGSEQKAKGKPEAFLDYGAKSRALAGENLIQFDKARRAVKQTKGFLKDTNLEKIGMLSKQEKAAAKALLGADAATEMDENFRNLVGARMNRIRNQYMKDNPNLSNREVDNYLMSNVYPEEVANLQLTIRQLPGWLGQD